MIQIQWPGHLCEARPSGMRRHLIEGAVATCSLPYLSLIQMNTTNLIKESIRMGYNDFGDFHYSHGNLGMLLRAMFVLLIIVLHQSILFIGACVPFWSACRWVNLLMSQAMLTKQNKH